MSLGFLGSGAHRLGIPGMGSAGSTLGSGAGAGFSPTQLGNLAAWYDVANSSSLIYDSSNRVSLLADRSGNSGVNVLALNGVAGNNATAPDSVPLSITGDIDIQVRLMLPSWQPASSQAIVSKWVAPNKSYFLRILNGSTGTVQLITTADGTTERVASSTVNLSTASYTTQWLRATRDSSTGNTNFYTATDQNGYPGSWTPLGATAGSTAGGIFDGTTVLSIGADQGDGSSVFNGIIYRVGIFGVIGGSTPVFDADFSKAAKLAASFTESSANAATVTINTTGDTGARICGARDLVNLTAANQPIYLPYSGSKYAYLNAVAGNYLSAPDAAPLRITGDIGIFGLFALNAWSFGSEQNLASKWVSTGNQRSYALAISSLFLKLYWSNDGVAVNSAVSTSTLPFTAGQKAWVYATMRVNDGGGNRVIKFYYALDNGSLSEPVWTQLGTTVTVAGTTSIFNSTAIAQVGCTDAGISGLYVGNVYRAAFRNGYDGAGTIQFDFNPSTYVSGTTLTDASANAATITINGGATIVTRSRLYFNGTSHYLKAAGFALSQPETVYLVGSQPTWAAGQAAYDGNTINTMQLQKHTASPKLNLFAGSNLSDNSDLALQTVGVVSSVFNGSSSSLRVNRLTAVTGNVGSATPNGIMLAAYNNAGTPGGFANITASELALYSAAHDDATQQRMALYEGQKWSIAV